MLHILAYATLPLQLKTFNMLEKKNLDYEKVVLVGVITATQNEEKAHEYLDELEF